MGGGPETLSSPKKPKTARQHQRVRLEVLEKAQDPEETSDTKQRGSEATGSTAEPKPKNVPTGKPETTWQENERIATGRMSEQQRKQA